ncbi:Galactan beta-1,4-galactosyltransferase gals1 [Datura stramonium]|uniref:Glycosyltransferase family 92 protein n=1 Tax=Datura stramonium TaxID=4076 RepID=A0ABS8SQD7_DATST|nr:Galactan beta-1,4-galactosyltransferase gals1 [Datura stramonium]
MAKESSSTLLSAGKMSFCFDTKPLVATLLAFTLVMLIWNLQPYYDTILNSPATPTPTSTSTSSKLSIASPNKRTFVAYGNAASLFVQMGAYRGGPTTFAVVGLASKPLHVFGHPWYKCEWIPNSNGNASSPASKNLKAKAYKILPDWGYGRVYTVVVVNCTFSTNPNADNRGGKLILYAYYGESPKRYEKITALEEEPGSYNESKFSPPYSYEYLYCGSSLYGNLSASRMREWMAYHAWFFGPSSHFVFHDAGGVSPEVRAVLEPWLRAGRVTLQDIRDQSEFDGYYYNQFLVVNDCLHRYRHTANWTFYFDVDEYIYLPDGNSTLESVLREFSNNTQFTIEQNAMSSMLCLNDSSQDYSRQWGFEKLLFRDSRSNIRRDRKYAIQAKNAYATGVHMSENVVGGTLHQTETKIRYYHYHNSITVHEELCREFVSMSAKHNITWFDKLPYVYDDNMKKLAQTIKDFERNTINAAPDHYHTNNS